jgi:hypothetical protein
MSEVSPAMRSEILSALNAARRHLGATRDAAEIGGGHMGFELADANLRDCTSTIEQLTDRDQIIDMLKRTYDSLPLMTGGAARPVVEHIRDTIVDLWEELEPPAD